MSLVFEKEWWAAEEDDDRAGGDEGVWAEESCRDTNVLGSACREAASASRRRRWVSLARSARCFPLSTKHGNKNGKVVILHDHSPFEFIGWKDEESMGKEEPGVLNQAAFSSASDSWAAESASRSRVLLEGAGEVVIWREEEEEEREGPTTSGLGTGATTPLSLFSLLFSRFVAVSPSCFASSVAATVAVAAFSNKRLPFSGTPFPLVIFGIDSSGDASMLSRDGLNRAKLSLTLVVGLGVLGAPFVVSIAAGAASASAVVVLSMQKGVPKDKKEKAGHAHSFAMFVTVQQLTN